MTRPNSLAALALLISGASAWGQIGGGPDSTGVDSVLRASQVQVLTLYDPAEGGVILRWAPDGPDGWLQGNRHGYGLVRVAIDSAGRELDGTEVVLVDTLRPRAREAWIAEAEADSTDGLYATALQTIHGEWEAAGEGIIGATLRNEELVNRYSFCLFAADLSARAAQAAGLRYVDRDVAPGRGYAYYVSVHGGATQHLPARTGVGVVWTSPAEPLPQIVATAVAHERHVAIQWARAYADTYTAFWVERAGDDGAWRRLDDLPYVHGQSDDEDFRRPFMSYTDSVANYAPHRYRVRGIDAFGRLGPAGEPIVAAARDRTPPPPPRDVGSEELSGEAIVLTWTQDDPGDLAHYNLYRGYHVDQPLALIAAGVPATARTYADTGYAPLLGNYYIIEVVDTAGNAARGEPYYAMLWDSIPPEPPVGLSASVDSNGVVDLAWEASPSADVIGYKVLMANDLEHEFSLLTGEHLPGRRFRDSVELRTTTPYVYYRVMAVDHRFNYSELSEPLAVKRPDVLPPNSPVWRGYAVTDSTIELTWSPSRSRDVTEHRLYRRPDGGEESLLGRLGGAAEAYVDGDLSPGRGYTYRLVAVDTAGLLSNPITTLYLEAPRLAPKPLAVDLTVVDADGSPELRWTLVDEPAAEVARAEVFRMRAGGELRRLGSVAGGAASYVDRSAAAGERYAYVVRLRLADGRRSGFSADVGWE